MKKQLLLVSIFLAFFGAAQAQVLTASNYILTVSDPGNQTALESFARIQNNSTNAMNVQVERTVINLPAGMDELFCFGIYCNPPGTASTSYNTLINPGAQNSTFKADVLPNGNCGTATIKYNFYDIDTPSDSVAITLNFAFCTVGLNENAESFGMSRPLRNPADQFTVFAYNLQNDNSGDKLLVYNMLGSLVKTMDVTGKSGSLVLSTSDLKPGVYFASYLSNNKVKNSYKLVVAHR